MLPTARSGLTTAVILGTARGIGETSPVLLTAGYTATSNIEPVPRARWSRCRCAVFQLVQVAAADHDRPRLRRRGRPDGARAGPLRRSPASIGGRGPGNLTRAPAAPPGRSRRDVDAVRRVGRARSARRRRRPPAGRRRPVTADAPSTTDRFMTPGDPAHAPYRTADAPVGPAGPLAVLVALAVVVRPMLAVAAPARGGHLRADQRRRLDLEPERARPVAPQRRRSTA